MIIQAFYYDPCILPNSVIADTNEGLYLFREGGIVHLTEKPHSASRLDLEKERWFFHKISNNRPKREHLSKLNSIYTSKMDTIFFIGNGAVLKLFHRNTNSYLVGLHYASRPIPEPAPVFYSAQEAEKFGILETSIAASPFYSKLNLDLQTFVEPVETAYIVYPGWLLQNESSLFSNVCLRAELLSVDFIMNEISPKENPTQFNQFWQVPSLFCSLTHASFDHNTWNSQTKCNVLPEEKAYAFSLHNECIAEIICVDTSCEPGYFPYHDSFTLTLHYQKAFDSEVQNMIHLLLKQYDNIIPVPPHLCDGHE